MFPHLFNVFLGGRLIYIFPNTLNVYSTIVNSQNYLLKQTTIRKRKWINLEACCFDSHSYTWSCFQTNGFVNEYKSTNTTCLQSLRRVEGFWDALLTSGKWFKAPKPVLKLCAVIRNFRSAPSVNGTVCATIFTELVLWHKIIKPFLQ